MQEHTREGPAGWHAGNEEQQNGAGISAQRQGRTIRTGLQLWRSSHQIHRNQTNSAAGQRKSCDPQQGKYLHQKGDVGIRCFVV